MTSATHLPRYDDLLPGYALGTLEGDELRELAAHLAAGCPACEAELRRLAADMEELAAAASALPERLESSAQEILDGVKRRLLEELPRVPREAPAAHPPPAPPMTPMTLAPLAPSAPLAPPPAPFAGRRHGPARPGISTAPSARSWPLLAAAAVLAVVAVWGVVRQASMGAEIEQLRGESRRLAARAAALEREAGAAQAETRRLERTLAIIAAPGVDSVRLAGMGTSHAAAGRTYVNVADRKAVFYAFGLPALGRDKSYQLWFLDDQDHPTSAGVFDVDAQGKATLVMDQALPVERIQAWAVTVEPRGGRPQPTGPMALAG